VDDGVLRHRITQGLRAPGGDHHRSIEEIGQSTDVESRLVETDVTGDGSDGHDLDFGTGEGQQNCDGVIHARISVN
jgi:hypothetical protein